jgi:predicted metal-dependent HD superfamily phosphohydrolase
VILVDAARWRWRGELWAHLVSDTSYQELHEFAARLGIPGRAFQEDHYDVPSDYRQQAIALGAIPVSSRELVVRLRAAGLRRAPARISLAGSWAEAVVRLGGQSEAAARTGAELARRYREPHRRYHTTQHIRAVLGHGQDLADEVGLPASDRAALTLAACAHDVVYDAQPGEDEKASARWVRLRLGQCGLPAACVDRVASAVLATTAHASPEHDIMFDLLFDADLAILAAPDDVYDRYVTGVRMEYSSLDDEAWQRGRARVLEDLAAREVLFFTAAARARWEATARSNIDRELRALRPSP